MHADPPLKVVGRRTGPELPHGDLADLAEARKFGRGGQGVHAGEVLPPPLGGGVRPEDVSH
mgnify:CR=1 FL=1